MYNLITYQMYISLRTSSNWGSIIFSSIKVVSDIFRLFPPAESLFFLELLKLAGIIQSWCPPFNHGHWAIYHLEVCVTWYMTVCPSTGLWGRRVMYHSGFTRLYDSEKGVCAPSEESEATRVYLCVSIVLGSAGMQSGRGSFFFIAVVRVGTHLGRSIGVGGNRWNSFLCFGG